MKKEFKDIYKNSPEAHTLVYSDELVEEKAPIPTNIKIGMIAQEAIKFSESLRNFIGEEYMTNFYRNVSSYKLVKMHSLFVGGKYFETKNIVFTGKSAYNHEMLHLSSSYYDKDTDTSYMGFLQVRYKDGKIEQSIGNALNEGFTEYLALKLFKNTDMYHMYENGYSRRIRAAEMMLQLFDDPKDAYKYYFNNDLPGFVDELSKYSSKEEALKLINDMDTSMENNKDCNDIMLRIRAMHIRKTQDVEDREKFDSLLIKNNIARYASIKKGMKLQDKAIYTNVVSEAKTR